jgi:hypothetical protein
MRGALSFSQAADAGRWLSGKPAPMWLFALCAATPAQAFSLH